MVRAVSTYLFIKERLHPGILDGLARSGVQAIEIFAARQHLDYANRKAHVKEIAEWFRGSGVPQTEAAYHLSGGVIPARVPIGKFQVLQHRMVDCFTNAQEARSMTLMATLKIDDKDPVVRAKAASGAKVQIGKSGKFCGQSAVQMHGGMGVTDELSVSHYFKRLTMIDLMFGNQQHHLTRYSNLAMAA